MHTPHPFRVRISGPTRLVLVEGDAHHILRGLSAYEAARVADARDAVRAALGDGKPDESWPIALRAYDAARAERT